MVYLNIDIKNLLECSLTVPMVEENFYTQKMEHSMNNTDKLSSIFAPYIKNYIREKEVQCLDTKLHESYLSEFDNYLVHISKENLLITSEDFKNWAENRTNDKPSTLYSRFRIIAKFCRYMCRLGHECYVPVNPKCSFDRAVSTVFTHEQILDIFDEGDNIISRTKCPKNKLMPVPALIRTLYSTGRRIGEALSIKNKDVDFLRKAKGDLLGKG